MYLLHVALVVSLVLQIINGVPTGRSTYCQKKIDLAFVIDTSSSIPIEDFKLEIQFVRDIVSFLEVGTDYTRVAAVSFSNYLYPQFGFNDYQTKAQVLQAISKIPDSMGDATRTYLALNHTNNVIFAPGNGERPDVIDVVIVLTDGVTNPGSYDYHWGESAKTQTQIEAAEIKARPSYVFAIGIGSQVDVNELNGISSDPDDKFTILVSSFKELNSEDVKQMLLDRACPGPKPIISTSAPRKTTQSCTESKSADVFFIVDESSSLKVDVNFRKELNFIRSVIDEYELEPSKVRVGLMTFANNASVIFHLNDFKTKSEIATILERIPWRGGNTYLDKALTTLMAEGLSPSYGSRINVPQIAVVITDGKSTAPMATKRVLADVRKKNYVVYAIGVGPERDPSELALIASDPSRVYEVENLNGLAAIQRELVAQLCQGDRTPPPTANPITCKGAETDIIFVADSSSSIGYQGYDELKEFAKSVVERITKEENSIRVGFMTFSDDAHTEFNLNTYKGGDEIVKAIDQVSYRTGNTNTHKALELLYKYGFQGQSGGRQGVRKIAIVITDGESRQPTETMKLAKKAQSGGIVMFSIGVGPYINQNELDAMASTPTSMYSFSVKNFAALSSIERSLAERTCSAATPRFA